MTCCDDKIDENDQLRIKGHDLQDGTRIFGFMLNSQGVLEAQDDIKKYGVVFAYAEEEEDDDDDKSYGARQ
jgi:hypothetical protein